MKQAIASESATRVTNIITENDSLALDDNRFVGVSDSSPCPHCGAYGRVNFVRMPKCSIHHAAKRCSECDAFLGWEPKPETKERHKKRRTLVKTLLQQSNLTTWEREFLLNIQDKRKLSPKQEEVLTKIAAKKGGQN